MSFGSIRNDVLDELFKTGSLTAQAENHIKKAIEHYKYDAFWFNEQISTAQTIAGQEYMALPDDYGDDFNLSITINTNSYPLKRRTFKEMEELYVSSQDYNGYPQDYCLFKRELRLGPIPAQAWKLTMAYRRFPLDLSASADTNIFTDNAENLILSRAASTVSGRILRDQKRAVEFKALEKEARQKLSGTTARYVMRGHGQRRK